MRQELLCGEDRLDSKDGKVRVDQMDSDFKDGKEIRAIKVYKEPEIQEAKDFKVDKDGRELKDSKDGWAMMAAKELPELKGGKVGRETKAL